MEIQLKACGLETILAASDGAEAFRLVCRRLPDLLVADAVLPGLDGVSLANKVLQTPLARYPATLVTAVPGMFLRALPEGCVALEKPIAQESLKLAIFETRPERRAVPENKRRQAQALLDKVGIPDHCGRSYLLRAVEMVWLDARLLHGMTRRLYPAVAAAFGCEARHVERAMRHVIDLAWRGGEIEAQYKIFGDTIDARRGNPTCGEMIAQIADILRWEGRA